MKLSRPLVVVLALGATLAAAGLARPPAHAQARKFKVHISVDMEGVAGTVTPDQLGPAGFEYGRFREFMTREALAAVDGGHAGGATESWSPTPTATARTCSSSSSRPTCG